MLSMPSAGWFENVYSPGLSIMFPLAILLGVMGILAYLQNRALDAIVFFGGSGLFWSNHQWIMSSTHSAGRDAGWFLFVWAVFFCYVWFGAFRAGLPRCLFLLGLWLTLLTLAIGYWGGMRLHIVSLIGGYMGLVTAILAAIVSAIAVISNGCRAGGPNEDSPATAA
jgi:succinate-acetate transporter protein